MHDIHKTLYLMAKRDEDLLNEGLKAKVAAGAILGGIALGMIPPPQPKQTPPQTQQTQQTPPQTQQTPSPTPATPPITPIYTLDNVTKQLYAYESGGADQDKISMPFDDHRGNLTLGHGHLLALKGQKVSKETVRELEAIFSGQMKTTPSFVSDVLASKRKLTADEKQQMFTSDVSRKASQMTSMIPKFDTLPFDLRDTLTAEHFRGGISDSKKTLGFINSGSPGLAAVEFLNNDEYRVEKPRVGKDGKPNSVVRRMEAVRDSLLSYQASIDKAAADAKAAAVKAAKKTTPTIKKESYKDKMTMYLREAKGQLPGSDIYFDYGEVFGPKGIMSPKDGLKEPGSGKLIPRITTTSKYGLPIVQSNGHRIGTDGILSVKSHTNINRKHPKFGQIETHVYDGNTRIATFTSAFNRGALGMTHTPTNDLFFESDSNSEQSIRRREMDAGSEEFFNRELNKKTAEYDRDDKIRDVIDDHFNETMGGRRNMSISEFHRTYIEKEFPPPPSDGPGDGSSYGELT